MYSRAVLLERLQLAALRGLAVFLALYAAVFIRHDLIGSDPTPWRTYLGPAVAAAIIVPALSSARVSPLGSGLWARLLDVLPGFVAGVATLLALTFFFREVSYSRGTTLLFLPLGVVGLIGANRAHELLQRRLRSSRSSGRRLLIIGTDGSGRRVGAALAHQPGYYDLIGYLDESPVVTADSIEGVPVLGTASDLAVIASKFGIDEVILGAASLSPERAQELVGRCMARGLDWKVVPPMLGLIPDRVEIDFLGGLPIVGPKGSKLVGQVWYIKRAFDLAIAIPLTVLMTPVMLVIALLVKATSRGPVIFRQTRIGLRGEPFTFLKFRSMRTDSSTEVHEDYTERWILGSDGGGDQDTGVHKLISDSRVTRVGRVLRAISFDELPQLFNVIRGEMSLVGPRPPVAYEVERYTEWHKRRLEVPPGITGLWQVSGRNNLSFEEMIDLDIEYVENWSVKSDLAILLRTLPAVALDRGH